ncbi:hypothetical protein KEM55_002494 [Ascosphaera atra]|nr:hypothetical protein KEM55_002494 [Ascosphaera atra]
MAPKKTDKTVTRSRKGKADEQEQQPSPMREEEDVEPGQSGGDVDRTHPNKEGGGDAEERVDPQEEAGNSENKEEEGGEQLREADVEALLRDQQQQYVEKLAQQEQELARLQQALAAQQISVNNHAQPPAVPTARDAEGNTAPPVVPEDALAEDIISILRSLQGEVAKLKRPAPEHEAAPPHVRPRTEAPASPPPPPSSTSTIPGLPADVSGAAKAVVMQPHHPAYGLSPNDMAMLRYKCRPQGINPRDKLSTEAHNYQAWEFTLQEKFLGTGRSI